MKGTAELLVATRNDGKLRELRQLLSSLPIYLRSLDEYPEVSEVEETGRTFAENAILKARTYAAQTRQWTLADDSGLEVDALNGAPGVYSARYGGPGLKDEDRTRRLLEALKKSGDTDRHARFVCVIAIADPQGAVANLSTGKCEGRIAHEPRGANGFGYDPVFVPLGPGTDGRTFAELSPEEKDAVSHRGRAFRALAELLTRLS